MNAVRHTTVRRRNSPSIALAAVSSAGALLLAACGGGSGFEENDSESSSGDGPITVLIGSSGDAETEAVQDAVSAWAKESGTDAKVQAAADLNQELAQGFSGGKPPDVFYLSTDALAGYASNGSLEPYASDMENADAFFPTLVDAFTFEDQFWCAPKDFSTLALVINTKLWKQAGLTDDDVPTTWAELESVAQQLTKGKTVGLAFSPEFQRVGAFAAQAGGGLTNENGTEATVNSEANVEALEFVKKMLNDGTAAYSSDLGAGWGGEAFGKQLSAMTIEGNWIKGAMDADFPDIDYQVAELPAGPAGQGTLQFTNCWGVAADSDNIEGAVSLVEYLTTPEQQLAFADAFGVMPSVEDAADQWKQKFPEDAAFIDEAEYAQNLPTQEGAADVVADLNAKLATLKDSDPQAILDDAQKNMEAVVAG
jgi:multiple sugar transport system substrate-binding protein